MDNNKATEYFNKYAGDIYRYIYARCYNVQLAEDVTATAFEKLLSQKDLEESAVKFWLMRVAKNNLIDRGRKASTKNIDLDGFAGTEFDIDSTNYSEEVVEQTLVDQVQTYLQDLDSETREIITLRIWEEMSFSKIGELVNMPADTAKKRFYRGIDFIKSKITREEKQNKQVIAAILGVASLSAFTLSPQFISLTLTSMSTGTAAAATSAASTAAAASTTGGTATGVAGLSTPVIGGIIATSVIAVGGVAAVATGAVSLPNSQSIITSSFSTSSAPVSYTSTTSSETSTTTSEAPATRERPTLPAGWTWTKFDKCDMEIPTPPDGVSYQVDGLFDNNPFQVNWQVRDLNVGGSFFENTKQITGVRFFNGNAAGTDFNVNLIVSCYDLNENIKNKQFVDEFRNALPESSTDKGVKYPWGFETRLVTVNYGPADGTSNIYMFVQGGKGYQVSGVYGGEAEGKVAQQIFNNLYFKQAPACVDKTIKNPLLKNFSYKFNTCEWRRNSTYKSGYDQGSTWKDTLTHNRNGGKLVLSFFGGLFDATPTCRNGQFKILNNGHARIKLANNKYEYWYEIYPKGTAEFDTYLDTSGAIRTGVPANPNFCRMSDVPFWLQSTIIDDGSSAGPGAGNPWTFMMKANYQGANPATADEIMETLRYKDTFDRS